MDAALWAIGRASGLVLVVLMTANLLLGLLTRSGRRTLLPRFGTALLHRNVALLSVVFLAVHVLTMLLDSYAGLTPVDVVVPFLASSNPVGYGLGTVALDLVLAVVATALLRHRIGARAFKAVHWAAYLLWPTAVLHGIASGSDSSVVLGTSLVCLALVGAAVVWRGTAGFVEHRAVRAAVVR